MDAELPDSHLLRCEAAALVLPIGAAITGRSAACVDGMPLAGSADPVRVLAPPNCRIDRPGIRARRTVWLPPGHLAAGPVPVTIRQRTAWEIASERHTAEAVVALDVLFRHKRPRKEAMAGWVAARPRSRAATAIALADERAESPQETRARLAIVAAGFPAPTPQFEVRAGSRFVARVDLAWPDARVAVEYDGLWHVGDARQMARDRARLNTLTAQGWTVLHLTARDLKDQARFGAFCAQLRAALAI